MHLFAVLQLLCWVVNRKIFQNLPGLPGFAGVRFQMFGQILFCRCAERDKAANYFLFQTSQWRGVVELKRAVLFLRQNMNTIQCLTFPHEFDGFPFKVPFKGKTCRWRQHQAFSSFLKPPISVFSLSPLHRPCDVGKKQELSS